LSDAPFIQQRKPVGRGPDVAEVAAAAPAAHLGADHEERPVGGGADGSLERLREARPARAAVDLIVIFMTQLMPSSAYPLRRELRVLTYAALMD